MTSITDTANSVFRDYASDGVPSSGLNEPAKADIRRLFETIDSSLTSVVDGVVIGGAVTYSTQAALFADLAHAAGVLGVVYNDATAVNNGVYVKSGTSGSGAWTITNLALPSTFAAQLAALQTAFSLGFTAATAWVTGHAYTVGKTVVNAAALYVCETAHTSGTFVTDLAAGKWTLIADFGALAHAGYQGALASDPSTDLSGNALTTAAWYFNTTIGRIKTYATGAWTVALNTVLTTSGAPSSATGQNGDFAIDSAAGALYGPKSAGAWPSATSLIGPTGATGLTGPAWSYLAAANGNVVAANAAALPAFTYSAGVMTANANGAFPAIDSVSLTVGQRFWHWDYTGANGSNIAYGIYTLTNAGSGSTAWTATRATDANTNTLLGLISAFVAGGTANVGKTLAVTQLSSAITLGSTAIIATVVAGTAAVAAETTRAVAAEAALATASQGVFPASASTYPSNLSGTTYIPQTPIRQSGVLAAVSVYSYTAGPGSILVLLKSGGTYTLVSRKDVYFNVGENDFYDFNPAVKRDGTYYIGVYTIGSGLGYAPATGANTDFITGIPSTSTAVSSSGANTLMSVGWQITPTPTIAGITTTQGVFPAASAHSPSSLAGDTTIPWPAINRNGYLSALSIYCTAAGYGSLLLLTRNSGGTYNLVDRQDVYFNVGENDFYDFNPAVIGDGTYYIGVYTVGAILDYATSSGAYGEWTTGIPSTSTAVAGTLNNVLMTIGWQVASSLAGAVAQKFTLMQGAALTDRYQLSGRQAGLPFPVPFFRPRKTSDGVTAGSGCIALDLVPNGTPVPYYGLITWIDLCDKDLAPNSVNYSSMRVACESTIVTIGPAAGGTGALKPMIVNPDGQYTGFGGRITPTCKLDVNGANIRIRSSNTPASSGASGNQGDVCWDSSYIYVCVAGNTWKRAALASW